MDEDDIPSLNKIARLVSPQFLFKIKQIPKPVLMEVRWAVAGAAANMAVTVDSCLATDKASRIQAFVGVGLAPDAEPRILASQYPRGNTGCTTCHDRRSAAAEKALEWGVAPHVFVKLTN